MNPHIIAAALAFSPDTFGAQFYDDNDATAAPDCLTIDDATGLFLFCPLEWPFSGEPIETGEVARVMYRAALAEGAAKLRRALADLLADVVDGTVKNGGNPRSLTSVKAASEVLTGDKFGFCGGEWKTARMAESHK